MASENYIFSLAPEETAVGAQQYQAHADDWLQQRTSWLQGVGEDVDRLGDWAHDFKHQMKHGTLPAAHAAGHRVYHGMKHHADTMKLHAKLPVEVDGEHAAKLNGIEPD